MICQIMLPKEEKDYDPCWRMESKEADDVFIAMKNKRGWLI